MLVSMNPILICECQYRLLFHCAPKERRRFRSHGLVEREQSAMPHLGVALWGAEGPMLPRSNSERDGFLHQRRRRGLSRVYRVERTRNGPGPPRRIASRNTAMTIGSLISRTSFIPKEASGVLKGTPK